MKREPGSLDWVTPEKYVGPAMLVILAVAATLVFWLASRGDVEMAILTLLGAVCLLLVGIADLLGELIRLGRRDETAAEGSEPVAPAAE